jgi:hypothetical protein
LHPTAVLQLSKKGFLDTKGNFVFSDTQLAKEKGRHLVMSMEIPVDDNGPLTLVFLKICPDLPMVDIAATELSALLVGPQLPWIELVKIHDADNFYPAIFCQGIRGNMISDVEIQTLDPESYSKRVFIGIFLNQEDGKDSNFIAKQNEESSKQNACFELVSVDNDRSFFPSLIHDESGEIFPQVKDISFLFDDMKTIVFSTVKESFLLLEPYRLLQNFLKILEDHEKAKNILFDRKDQEKFYPGKPFSFSDFKKLKENPISKECFLKFYLPENTIDIIFCKFLRIRNHLLNFQKTNHLDLLKVAEPYLARLYENLLGVEGTAVKRFQLGFGKFYGVNNNTSEFQTMKSIYHTLMAKHGSSVFEKDLKDCTSIKFHKTSLDIAFGKKSQLYGLISTLETGLDLKNFNFQDLSDSLLEELLLNLDFSLICESVQIYIFWILQARQYASETLCFKNSPILTLNTLVKILKSFPSLCILILMNCSQLNQSDLISQICKSSPNLLEIRLENFQKESLKFHTNSFLREVRFKESKLNKVILKKCTISEIIVNSPNLIKIEMLYCHGLNNIKTWSGMKNNLEFILQKSNKIVLDLDPKQNSRNLQSFGLIDGKFSPGNHLQFCFVNYYPNFFCAF